MAQILLIEDDDDIRELMSSALTQAGHGVRTARTGGHGLTLHKAHPADVLVVDLCTPGLSGLEAITALRASGDVTPIVAMSGASMLPDVEPPLLRRAMTAALDEGADIFLPKPFATRVLAAAIRRVQRDDALELVGSGAPDARERRPRG